MASTIVHSSCLTEPRSRIVTNAGDYTHDIHLFTGLFSVLSQKRSSMELALPDPSPYFAFQRTMSSGSPSCYAPPPIPKRSPSREHSPRQARTLRRKHSPVLETLREVRDKQSEMELQRLYEAQTIAYLTDSLPTSRRSSVAGYSDWSCSEDEDEDDEPNEPEFVLAPEHR